jgi:hypothetical protein
MILLNKRSMRFRITQAALLIVLRLFRFDLVGIKGVNAAPFKVGSDGVAVVALVAEHRLRQGHVLRHEIVVDRHVRRMGARHG